MVELKKIEDKIYMEHQVKISELERASQELKLNDDQIY